MLANISDIFDRILIFTIHLTFASEHKQAVMEEPSPLETTTLTTKGSNGLTLFKNNGIQVSAFLIIGLTS